MKRPVPEREERDKTPGDTPPTRAERDGASAHTHTHGDTESERAREKREEKRRKREERKRSGRAGEERKRTRAGAASVRPPQGRRCLGRSVKARRPMARGTQRR